MGRPSSFPAKGQISDRLRANVPADDPGWTPPREADAPVSTAKAGDGWAITGRKRSQ